ncbi:DUF4145 domain-containing protein [Mesorhizobium amorphae]|uniref:DUF4145 domain-containing protein n=1 Tax=Mesorhizobium amorphae TaxID=71433 RepID=UPI003F4FAE25
MSYATGMKKSHCNTCGGERNQRILHRESTNWRDDAQGGFSLSGSDDYFFLRCAGCEDYQFRHETFFSEDDPQGGPRVRLYPSAVSRREPTWSRDMIWALGPSTQEAIGELLTEIYTALQNDSRRSAAMAIRALTETIMVDKVGDQGAFGDNVKAFLAAGYVPPKSEKLFRETLIEGGHAAMHRSWKPTVTELETMMDLTEWLVASIYVHPRQAAAVQARIPPKSTKRK